MPCSALLLALSLLAVPILGVAFTPALSRQTSCPNQCKKNKSTVEATCMPLRASCRVRKCTRSNGQEGFTCKARKRTIPSPSTPQQPTTPQYKGAVICRSGNTIWNVGIVDVNNELHIPMFAKTEEKAKEWLECIKKDESFISVEEYLAFTKYNCVGEDARMCRVNDLRKGDCTCMRGQPDRCISVPYERAVRRCNDP